MYWASNEGMQRTQIPIHIAYGAESVRSALASLLEAWQGSLPMGDYDQDMSESIAASSNNTLSGDSNGGYDQDSEESAASAWVLQQRHSEQPAPARSYSRFVGWQAASTSAAHTDIVAEAWTQASQIMRRSQLHCPQRRPDHLHHGRSAFGDGIDPYAEGSAICSGLSAASAPGDRRTPVAAASGGDALRGGGIGGLVETRQHVTESSARPVSELCPVASGLWCSRSVISL